MCTYTHTYIMTYVQAPNMWRGFDNEARVWGHIICRDDEGIPFHINSPDLARDGYERQSIYKDWAWS